LSVVRVDATFKNRKNIPTGKIAHYSIAEHGIQTCAAALLLFLTLLLNTIIRCRTRCHVTLLLYLLPLRFVAGIFDMPPNVYKQGLYK